MLDCIVCSSEQFSFQMCIESGDGSGTFFFYLLVHQTVRLFTHHSPTLVGTHCVYPQRVGQAELTE